MEKIKIKCIQIYCFIGCDKWPQGWLSRLENYWSLALGNGAMSAIVQLATSRVSSDIWNLELQHSKV